MTRLIACLLALALTNSTPQLKADQKPGTQVATKLTVSVIEEATKKDVEMRYLQFLPEDYKSDGEARPVILFLHGAGERGTDIELVKKWGPPRIAEKQKDFPFIVISPQCPGGRGWDTRELLALVEHTCKTLNADPDRVYVTGLSMGGYGTWELIAAAPNRFAAGMPLCGRGEISKAKKLISTPIHAVIGGKDRQTTNDSVRAIVEAVKAAGGKNIDVTLHEDLGHNVWSRTYENPDTWKWLLSHKRSAE
jgi:predicted peptidase